MGSSRQRKCRRRSAGRRTMTKRRGEEFVDVRFGNVVIVVDVETVEEREGGRAEAAEGIRKKKKGGDREVVIIIDGGMAVNGRKGCGLVVAIGGKK